MNFDELLHSIKSKLDTTKHPNKLKVALLYASNTTGKTRLSKMFKEQYEEDVLCYNAFMEDLFSWDNENVVLKIDRTSWLAELINDEGLDGEIIDNFKKLTNSKIEPIFDIPYGVISFGNHTGDEVSSDNIKISRGEESLFIWSIFYTILSFAISTLQETPENRSTTYFNNIKYIVIDDPVSSMDDTRIITIALELIELINRMCASEDKLKVLITTHHSLFFNVLHSEHTPQWHKKSFVLSKTDTNELCLDEQNSDSPFAYHNLIFTEICKAIKNNDIQKYHFNLFRALLEKTANFLGYKKWSDILEENDNKKLLVKILNHYSHSSLSEIEASKLQTEDINAFKETFEAFKKKFHWSCENE